jgi:hypothetical protein
MVKTGKIEVQVDVKEPTFLLPLGAKVKDIATGFMGFIVARHQYLYGCNRYSLQGAALHESKPISWQTFDEPQLVLVKNAKSLNTDVPVGSYTGGPKPEPSRGR